jgi:hypothetical protein
MALQDLFESLQKSGLGRAIAGSSWAFPTIETVHVFFLATVLGAIAIVDLRLMGWASNNQRVTEVLRRYTPYTWYAFIGAFLSGGLLFISRAGDYAVLPVFWMKFGYMALAGLNMAWFHFATERNASMWDLGPPAPAAKIAGGLSLLLWASVVICARRIGFHM